MPGVDRIQGYRYPAPSSREKAHIPTSSPEKTYDIGYFKRDTSDVTPKAEIMTAPRYEGLVPAAKDTAGAQPPALEEGEAALPRGSPGNKVRWNPEALSGGKRRLD
jgi:hypothetical protein